MDYMLEQPNNDSCPYCGDPDCPASIEIDCPDFQYEKSTRKFEEEEDFSVNDSEIY